MLTYSLSCLVCRDKSQLHASQAMQYDAIPPRLSTRHDSARHARIDTRGSEATDVKIQIGTLQFDSRRDSSVRIEG
jgi:hypothetical protein